MCTRLSRSYAPHYCVNYSDLTQKCSPRRCTHPQPRICVTLPFQWAYILNLVFSNKVVSCPITCIHASMSACLALISTGLRINRLGVHLSTIIALASLIACTQLDHYVRSTCDTPACGPPYRTRRLGVHTHCFVIGKLVDPHATCNIASTDAPNVRIVS